METAAIAYAWTMKIFCLVLLAVSATLVASPQESTASTDGSAWGSAVNGLRLGVAFSSHPSKPTIRIIFENVSRRVQEVLLGYSNGRGPVYNLKFIVKAGDGKMLEAADIGMFYPVEGLVQPVSVSLGPVHSRQHELVFPLKNIFVYSSPTVETFESLLNKGYSVRVTFEAQRGEPPLDTLSNPWIGKAESAEVSRSR